MTYYYARTPLLKDGKIVALWDVPSQSYVPFSGIVAHLEYLAEQDQRNAEMRAALDAVAPLNTIIASPVMRGDEEKPIDIMAVTRGMCK
jgi:hypothetical protein